jgi:FMN-dependent NADH-azoreductase
MVIADPRMAAGTKPVLAAKPAVLVTVHGGNYRPGIPREGWDHATGWMRRILGDVWQLDLRAVEAEFTNVGVNPALDRFQDLGPPAAPGGRRTGPPPWPRARRPGRDCPAEGRLKPAPVPAEPHPTPAS